MYLNYIKRYQYCIYWHIMFLLLEPLCHRWFLRALEKNSFTYLCLWLIWKKCHKINKGSYIFFDIILFNYPCINQHKHQTSKFTIRTVAATTNVTKTTSWPQRVWWDCKRFIDYTLSFRDQGERVADEK